MAARKNKKSLLLVLVVLALLVAGFLLMKSKPSTVTQKTSKEETSKTVTQTPTSVAVQGLMSGPVGRNALRAYAGPNRGEITLEWQRYFLEGENYNIHYGIKSKTYPYEARNIGYISTYIVKGLTPGTKYYFVVEGIVTGGISRGWDGEVSMVAPSGSVSVVVSPGPIGRNFLTATTGPQKGQVTLNWQRFNPDTEKYSVVYGTTPGKYTFGLLGAVDTTPQDNAYRYVISSLASGTRYYFALVPQRGGQGIYVTAEVSTVAP